MKRLLVVLLLHHIEGVCKPRSPLGRIVDNFLSAVAERDRPAAVERARQRQAQRQARAQARRPAPRPQPVQVHVVRPALSATRPEPDIIITVVDEKEEQW